MRKSQMCICSWFHVVYDVLMAS